MTDPIRYWKFNATASTDAVHVLNPDADFIGTWSEAEAEAKRLADEWENMPENGLVMILELESHGIVKP